MTFDEILAQIIDLLKRQGRVSYGALKRRFDLDDDYLNDLKNEILYVHPVIDDKGRGLIWAGDTASGQAGAPQPAQTTQSPAAQAQQPVTMWSLNKSRRTLKGESLEKRSLDHNVAMYHPALYLRQWLLSDWRTQ